MSLALLVEDPDVPKEIREDGLFVHWIVYNIPPECTGFVEGNSAGDVGENTRVETRYTGPCPPKEYEPSVHRYVFTLYALDRTLDTHAPMSRERLLKEVKEHVIGKATLTGTYKKV